MGGTGILGADIGWTTILALLLCIPVGVLGYFVARKLNRREFTMLPATAEQFRLFGSVTSQVEALLGEWQGSAQGFAASTLALLAR